MKQHHFNSKEEWLEFRKSRIGASDAPIILGKSPFKTPLQLWREKLDLEKGYTSQAMQRGIDMEKKALLAYCDKMEVVMDAKVIEHPSIPWLMASLDGADKHIKRIVEIKCPGSRDQSLARSGVIPEHYQIQMQTQMAVTGLSSVDYWSFDGTEGVLLKLDRDDDFIFNKLIPALTEFYDCMINIIPPDGMERDYVPMDSHEWRELAIEYSELKEKIRSLDSQADIIKARLIGLCNSQPAKGGGVTLSKSSSTSYDMKAIEKDVGPLEKYKVRKEYLKVTVYKE